jgi:tellurite resistance protein
MGNSFVKPLKHNKVKNTGILFELLVRKVASEIMNNTNSKALPVIKKFFKEGTALSSELKLYKTLLDEKFNNESKADKLIASVIDAHTKIDENALSKEKYALIREIKNRFDLRDFFDARVNQYTQLASIYKIFEYRNSFNPADIVRSKENLIEHITNKPTVASKVVNEAFAAQDKEVRVLSSKLLVDKFNQKYKVLSADQKSILREYVNNVTDSPILKESISKKVPMIKKEINMLSKKVDNKITKIKLTEVANMLDKIASAKLIKESHVLSMLRYYELVDELKKAIK